MCYIGQLAGELFRASRCSDRLSDRNVLVLILMIIIVVIIITERIDPLPGRDRETGSHSRESTRNSNRTVGNGVFYAVRAKLL
jgi:hypothetical protein